MGAGVRLEFRIPGEGVPKLRARHAQIRGRSMAFTPKKVVDFENRVRLCADEAVRQFHAEQLAQGRTERSWPTEAAVRVLITSYRLVPASFSHARRAAALAGLIFPTSRPDRSNLAKTVEDGLEGIVYVNDAQIVDGRDVKMYGEEAFTQVEVEVLPEPEPEPRVVSVETRLAHAKHDAKTSAALKGHKLSVFRHVEESERLVARSKCKACTREAVAVAVRAAKDFTVSGEALQAPCG